MKKIKLISNLVSFTKGSKEAILFWLIVLIWFLSYPFLPLNFSEEKVSFEIENGSNISKISKQLIDTDILKDSFRFRLLSLAYGKSESFKRGQYEVNKSITPLELLNTLSNGKEILYSITFIEGQTVKKILNTIKRNKYLKKTIKSYDDDTILKLIKSDYKYAEGLLFPESYYFYKDTSDAEVIRNSFGIMIKKLDDAWIKRAPNLPYKNKYEALIIASMIEKELGKRSEARMIAGVFVNRLKLNMKLQSDPTVIYGMGEKYSGNLRHIDLKADTPFNTYTRFGYPKSPICSPGIDAIEAALNPSSTKALYFVAKGDRTHYFSNTLKQHNAAVRKYQIGK
jgi:UPF0755 protein